MNRAASMLLVGMLALALVVPAIAFGEELTPKEIVKRSDEKLRGAKSYSILTMEIVRPEWSRTMKMKAWTEGTEKAFIRVLSPAKDKDTAFLKIGREAWQYIPAIERTMKIPPSMMLQSWMGSDFTNDDLVRADSLVVDYTHKIIETPTINGVECWKIELKPKPNAAVVWGKIEITIRKDNLVSTRADYYNEDNELVKYFETADIKTIEGKVVPTKFTMHDVKKKGHSTTMIYEDLTFSPNIPPNTFTVSNLKK